MKESKGTKVHDINGKVVGNVCYPYWIINDSYFWKKKASLITPKCIGSKFNVKRQEIEFITAENLITYKIAPDKIFSTAYKNKMPVSLLLGTCFLNAENDKLYSYEINQLPIGDVTIGALNLNSNKWESIGTAHTPTQLHHHIGFWDKNRNRYLVFGGFGSEQYSNKFLTYNPKTDKWDKMNFKGDKITPRFYSSVASTKNGNFLYLYGGVGNVSGDQKIGHVYYNDLYGIDLIHHTIKKYWEHPLKENRVPSEKMILSEDGRSLYVIRYAEYIRATFLKLYKININNGSIEQLGDSIPFASGSIKSTVTLYNNPVRHELYCVTHEFNEQANNVCSNIYTLVAPPISKSELNTYSYDDDHNYTLIIIVSIILSAGLLFFIMKNRRKKNHNIALPKNDMGMLNQRNISKAKIVTTLHSKNKTEKNQLYVYGRFAIYDRNNRDITYLLGKKLKSIFLYILLNSTGERDGVNSNLLNEIFWPEKTEEKAKNIKGVSINNLRKILSELDGIKLIYDKGLFKIEIDENICYCDLFHVQRLQRESSTSFEKYMSIWERGVILEDIKDPLFDKYKQESDEIILSVSPQEIIKRYKENKFKDVISICHIVLTTDPLNELALSYCLYSYKKINEFENVLKTYATFVVEYRKSMGEEYQKTIEDILNEM